MNILILSVDPFFYWYLLFKAKLVCFIATLHIIKHNSFYSGLAEKKEKKRKWYLRNKNWIHSIIRKWSHNSNNEREHFLNVFDSSRTNFMTVGCTQIEWMDYTRHKYKRAIHLNLPKWKRRSNTSYIIRY